MKKVSINSTEIWSLIREDIGHLHSENLCIYNRQAIFSGLFLSVLWILRFFLSLLCDKSSFKYYTMLTWLGCAWKCHSLMLYGSFAGNGIFGW